MSALTYCLLANAPIGINALGNAFESYEVGTTLDSRSRTAKAAPRTLATNVVSSVRRSEGVAAVSRSEVSTDPAETGQHCGGTGIDRIRPQDQQQRYLAAKRSTAGIHAGIKQCRSGVMTDSRLPCMQGTNSRLREQPAPWRRWLAFRNLLTLKTPGTATTVPPALRQPTDAVLSDTHSLAKISLALRQVFMSQHIVSRLRENRRSGLNNRANETIKP